LQCEAACALFVVLVRDATLDVFGPAEVHGSGAGISSARAPTSPAPTRAAPIRSTLARADKSGTPQP
jgi:hypothetical protein